VFVGAIAALLTLPAFRSQRDAIASLLTICPLHWFNDAGRSSSTHSVVRTGSDAVFSREELSMYDGSDSSPGIYLAILGSVYDVSSGRRHYGPDGGYGFFSGLSIMSFTLYRAVVCVSACLSLRSDSGPLVRRSAIPKVHYSEACVP